MCLSHSHNGASRNFRSLRNVIGVRLLLRAVGRTCMRSGKTSPPGRGPWFIERANIERILHMSQEGLNIMVRTKVSTAFASRFGKA